MRRLLISAVVLFFAGPAYGAQVVISINEQSQKMTVVVGGQQEYVWPVSTGVARYDTPRGTYTPFRMEEFHFSEEWDDAPMPHSIFFTRLGHAIHGTEHVDNLGRRASHGCVRLDPNNAATLFALVQEAGMPNTTVIITEKTGKKFDTTAKRNEPIDSAAVVTGRADKKITAIAVVEKKSDKGMNKRQPWPYERPN